MSEILNLADRGGLTEHSYVLSKVRELQRGEEVTLLAQDDPRMLMDAVTLELRNAIFWDIVDAGPPLWRVRIRHRQDVEAVDLVDLLTRDHERIDHLFATALHHTNAGNMAAAMPSFVEYAQRLRDHVEAENEIVVPVLELPRSPKGDDPTSLMIREHDEIVEHTVMIEEMVAEGVDDPGMLAPFFAIISGQLAKHEWREENNLFPHWMQILKHDPSIAQDLFPRVRGLVRFFD
ncbi:hemerythrin domain-containing protein [Acidihalobacter ferrooxydans]|uniref:Hemerythrin n=1 Tax=Acidihalobacter ferrooxydans TaxID=1765967 RepID=A0A1P8UD75_9GAMM|nr:hemerythrin domain-containing protein [Acidihalobacter ferrooxydans]APZ41709.1 hemerythrin [Acidihalobacter ferrooxydans]